MGEQSKVLKEMTNLTTSTSTNINQHQAREKTVLNPTIASPSNQRLTEGPSEVEKSTTAPNMQTMQAILMLIQETMVKMQETMFSNHDEMKVDIQKLDSKMNSIQEPIQKNEQKIKIVEAEQTGKKIGSGRSEDDGPK